MLDCALKHLKHSTLLLLSIISCSAWADLSSEPIHPIQAPSSMSEDKVQLGEQLFHDPRLSSNNSISCASCHNLANGGADKHPVSFGVNNAPGIANTPTVFNTSLNLAQFWDGRAQALDDQVNGPVHNPVEMNSNWEQITDKLNRDADLRQRFFRIYKDGINGANIRDALATFERSLLTVNAPFDQWLEGKRDALSEQQIKGYRLFKSYGCVSCHQGANVGGNMYAHFGAVDDIQTYFQTRGSNESAVDLGRYNVTGAPEDKHLFKVPSLRLAVKTAPYFHDGSVDTLQDAIHVMAKYQLGRDIPDPHVEAIVSFLHSLVGEHPRLQP